MKRLGDWGRDRTGRNRVGWDIREVIADLNPPTRLRNYFRTGNAANKFTQVDGHVAWRLKRLMIKQRDRNLRAGQTQQWTEDWFNGHGLHHPLPEDCVTMSRRSSLTRVRENRTHGLKGDRGNEPAKAPRP